MRALVATIRGESSADDVGANDALIDAHLLRVFQGRTLDELDMMDWPRYIRAKEVERVTAIEARRTQFLAGNLAANAIAADEWDAITEHDELMKTYTTRIDL